MKTKGFTLIELLVVLAVLGILFAIAIPAYLGVQGRTKMKSARQEASSLAAAMELYYQEHNRYGDDGTISGNDAVSDMYTAFNPSNNSIFNFDVTVADAGQTFTISVKPDTGQEFPKDYTELQLNQNNDFVWIE